MSTMIELWADLPERDPFCEAGRKTHIVYASGDSLCGRAKVMFGWLQISTEWLRQAESDPRICKSCLKKAKALYDTKKDSKGISIDNSQYKDAYVEIESVVEYEIKVKSRKKKSYSFGAASAKFNLKTSKFDVTIDPRIAQGIGKSEFYSTKECIDSLFGEIIASKSFNELVRGLDEQLSRI